MKEEISIFWFRRDLRLRDNAALFYALRENKKVLPLFIFDRTILDRIESKSDRRVDFIYQALLHLHGELRKLGSSLLILQGQPLNEFQKLSQKYVIKNIYCNNDYEPYALKRDQEVHDFFKSKSVPFHSFKDQCIFEKDEILKDDGKPYTVFTPYSKKWKNTLQTKRYKPFETALYFGNFHRFFVNPSEDIESIGFTKTDLVFNPNPPLSNSLLFNYKSSRDFPAQNGTSKLSVHLRFGTVSIRDLLARAIDHSEVWVNELIWREFYKMILWHFPYVSESAFKPLYNRILWRNNEGEFEMWCQGKTGFPIVDAGMRELNTTGFMHNRVRMIVSSFLVKDLLIDYRWGEAYFASKLNDFDLSANNGGWQWAAGCGCDAAPYFRIFNPTEQQKRFDPDFEYIRKWVPEFETDEYPDKMVDHAFARKRTLEHFGTALREKKQTALF